MTAEFKDRFPLAPPPQKESVTEAIELDKALNQFNEKHMADSVLVTREMLAKTAANLRPNWSHTDRLLMVDEFSRELGLTETKETK